MPVVDLREKLSLVSDHWSPKVVARMNDYEIKVVKVQGEFTWHVLQIVVRAVCQRATRREGDREHGEESDASHGDPRIR